MTLRPKSDRLTGLDSSQWNYARRPLYSELPMAAFGSEERSAHEQLPAASIQKVAIVHGHIIPYLRPDLKWTICIQIIWCNDLIYSIEKRAVKTTTRSLFFEFPFSENGQTDSGTAS